MPYRHPAPVPPADPPYRGPTPGEELVRIDVTLLGKLLDEGREPTPEEEAALVRPNRSR